MNFTELRIWYLEPTHHLRLFHVFFISELVLIPINAVIWVVGIRVAYKVRLHINLRLIILHFMGYYFIVLACRAITLLYQLKVLTYDGVPQDNFVIMTCSNIRTHFFSTILTGISCVFMERLAATYFIVDYERRSRLYVPCVLILYNMSISAVCTYWWTCEIVPWWSLAGIGVVSSAFGAAGFVLIYRHNRAKLALVSHNHHVACRSYSLSLRFQLDENIRVMKQLKTGFLLLGIQNIVYASLYAVSNTDIVRSLEDGWIAQFLDTLFNFLVATDGVIIALTVFLTDSTIALVVRDFKYIGWLIPTFHLRLLQEAEPISKDEGQLYFVTLQSQWERRYEQETTREDGRRPKTGRSKRSSAIRPECFDA